jgi:flagellar assembly protein FliH
MGLIKSSNAPANLAPFSMRDVEAHAKAILVRAQQQADQVLAGAQTEGARIRQNAYDHGFAAGREDGLRKGAEDGRASGALAALTEHRARLEQLAKTLTAAIAELDASRTRLESTAGTEVIKLAVAIARRVTKLQASRDPDVLTENILAAMKLVVHSTDVRIAIHPTQRQALTEILPKLRMQWPNVTHVELVDEAGLTPGACRILTADGQIDAELDRQIDRVASDLLPNRQGVVS